MFQWVRFFCRLGIPPRAPQSDILQQLLSHILKLGSCYSLGASASSSSPPASSLSGRQAFHTLRFTHLPPKRTEPLTFSLDHTQTLSQSEVFAISSFILRLRHRPTHTQTHSGHSHSEIPSHSAYSHSGPCTQGIPRGAARGHLYSQPDDSHSDSPNIKLTHTQADSYSNQPILMWQA